MAFEDFPDEASLRFRVHVLNVYAQSTLNLAAEIAREGRDNLTDDDIRIFNDLAEQCERIWIEATKVKTQIHAQERP